MVAVILLTLIVVRILWLMASSGKISKVGALALGSALSGAAIQVSYRIIEAIS